MCNCNNDSCGCIGEILKVILILQKNAEPGDRCLDTCDKKVLGTCCPCPCCNTRPIMLYPCCCPCGTAPIQMPISKDPDETVTSRVFRVEKLDGCCATFRVLVPTGNGKVCVNYEATNSFFTVNLNCIGTIKCLDDTYVECL